MEHTRSFTHLPPSPRGNFFPRVSFPAREPKPTISFSQSISPPPATQEAAATQSLHPFAEYVLQGRDFGFVHEERPPAPPGRADMAAPPHTNGLVKGHGGPKIPETQAGTTQSTSTLRNSSEPNGSLRSTIPNTDATTEMSGRSSNGRSTTQQSMNGLNSSETNVRQESSELSEVASTTGTDVLSEYRLVDSDDEDPMPPSRKSAREKRKRESYDLSSLKNGQRPSTATDGTYKSPYQSRPPENSPLPATSIDKFRKIKSETHDMEMLCGFWTQSPEVPDEDKHAVWVFIDMRGYLAYRVIGESRSGKQLASSPPDRGKVRRENVTVLPHLQNMSNVELKEYVKTQLEAHVKSVVAHSPAPTTTRNKKNTRRSDDWKKSFNSDDSDYNSELIKEKYTPRKRKPVRHFDEGTETPPLMPVKHSLALNTPSASVSKIIKKKSATHGPRQTDVLLGYWRYSDGPTEADKHAMYGIIKHQGAGQLRTKVVKRTRDGREYIGNFPQRPGQMFLTFEDVVLEPHLEGMERIEVQKYVEIRSQDLELGRPEPNGRAARELEAAAEAKAEIARISGAGGLNINEEHKKNESRIKTHQLKLEKRRESDISGNFVPAKAPVIPQEMVARTPEIPKQSPAFSRPASRREISASIRGRDLDEGADFREKTAPNNELASDDLSSIIAGEKAAAAERAKNMSRANREKSAARRSTEARSPTAPMHAGSQRFDFVRRASDQSPFRADSSAPMPSSSTYDLKDRISQRRQEVHRQRELQERLEQSQTPETSVKPELNRASREVSPSNGTPSPRAPTRSKIITLPLPQAQALAKSATAPAAAESGSGSLVIAQTVPQYVEAGGIKYERRVANPHKGKLARIEMEVVDDLTFIRWDILHPIEAESVRQISGKWWYVTSNKTMIEATGELFSVDGKYYEKRSQLQPLA